MRDSLRLRSIIAGLGTLCLGWHLAGIHRWFASPFATWAGWDEAYITVFAQRMIDGRWLPYVDAVSHRGPILYWLAALVQWMAGGYSWAAMRTAALVFAETGVLLAFAVGVVARRPLAGFLGAASLVISTGYSMEPKDGIGFNGELVAVPFVLLAAVLSTIALRQRTPGSESRIWLAAASGALVTIGTLCKQPAGLHLAPIALWLLATAFHERPTLGRLDVRPLIGFVVGTLTPALAVAAFFAQAGAWTDFRYYLFTYNRDVYMGPVTIGYALESTYLFWRDNPALLLLSLLGLTWAAARFASKLESWRPAHWADALCGSALTTTTALHFALALFGAIGTFRFWEHYFVTALPWFALLVGLLLEDALLSSSPARPTRIRRAYVIVVASFVLVSFVQRHLTSLWYDGVRRKGEFYLPPEADPIARYVRDHSSPEQSLFVWGFAPEIYVNAKRRSASRFVFTTFPSGLVPWFSWLTFDQENRLAVPGSRELLVRELTDQAPPLILDVPGSMHGRSMLRYPELASFLLGHYCFETTVYGHSGRVADIYHRREGEQPCPKPPPPMPQAK